MTDIPEEDRARHDSNPDTDEDEMNHRYDEAGNVDPPSEDDDA